jgi:hypothetical protein
MNKLTKLLQPIKELPKFNHNPPKLLKLKSASIRIHSTKSHQNHLLAQNKLYNPKFPNRKTWEMTNIPQKDYLLKKKHHNDLLNPLILTMIGQLSRLLWLISTTTKMLLIKPKSLQIIQKIEFNLKSENDIRNKTLVNHHMETPINLILSQTPMTVTWRIKT